MAGVQRTGDRFGAPQVKVLAQSLEERAVRRSSQSSRVDSSRRLTLLNVAAATDPRDTHTRRAVWNDYSCQSFQLEETADI